MASVSPPTYLQRPCLGQRLRSIVAPFAGLQVDGPALVFRLGYKTLWRACW
jgi:hypothetical protein